MPEPAPNRSTVTVGIISDTHGLLRPAALDALRGSDAIIHAGDIGRPEILDALRALAPLTVVRGNVDRQPWCAAVPETAVLRMGGVSLFVVHDIAQLSFDPAVTVHSAVIFGHSHRPGVEWRDGVLFLNPGSAGPRRFSLPISLARLRIADGAVSAEPLMLDP